MADVAQAFMRGHSYGLTEQQHQQQLAENKLRTEILKHQINGLKIEDKLRARDLAKQNLDFLHGQPAADIPSDEVTSQRPFLPAQSVAGMMTGLIRGRMGMGAEGDTGGDQPTEATGPSSVAAPAAQDTTPSYPVTSRVARPINIPGVEELGVPGVSVRPRSLEDLVRARIQEELTKPYNLAPGATRFMGGEPIAHGGPTVRSVGAGGLVETDAAGNTKVVVPGRAPTVPRPLVVNGQIRDPNDPSRVIATVPPQVRPSNPGVEQDRRDRAAAAAEQRQYNNDFREYTGHVATLAKQHADAFKAWKQKADVSAPGEAPEMPTYEPPSFEEWRAAKPGAAAPGAAPAAKPAGKAAAPKASVSPDGLTISADGKQWTFPSKAAAAAFKKEMGWD